VDATDLQHIRNLLLPALDYALKDAYYTAELFQAIWPKYLNSTPSMVALAGHYHLNGSVVPLVPDWPEWIERVEKSYDDHSEEMTKICSALVHKYYEEWKEEYDQGPEKAEEWVENDPWLRQLDWEVKMTKGRYANMPTWFRPFVKDPDTEIGVKSNISHYLLKLKWEGSPMVHTKKDGWQYTDESGVLRKIPHPKKEGANVGGVLSKEFVDDMATGRLSSDLPEAKRALEIANAVSYWTSVRNRVMNKIYIKVRNPHGEDAQVTLPEILAHGTVTRRTVESLMVSMCSTKSWRVGTELKTRVQAPDGWKIVGADFDGQELNIASIYSDKWEGGHIGCSPFGFSVLSGSKEKGTDPHSSLAKAVGIDRDTAKPVRFSMLYGAGVHSIQNFIRMRYPEKSPSEIKQFAISALTKQKGKLKNGLYEGGSDSGAFNYMEQIAMRSNLPQLPCLGTKISTAMRPSVVGDDFKTGRINWTIQASGAEILSIILTATHWLTSEFKVPYRFCLSIHDELWMMAPEKYAEQFAVVFQIAHLYTWSLFQHSVGMPDMPLSRAFFSTVAIDNRVRKSSKEKTVTPSNPGGKDEPDGSEYSMAELAKIGAVGKLITRYEAIKRGLL
jgi:DNA polymerase gamma 1